MEFRPLGRAGVKVSALCVGTMTWGNSTSEPDAQIILDAAMDAGINFVDTANVYSRGVSEEILGRAMAREGRREKLFVATKFTGSMGSGPNEGGSSRHHIRAQVEASLRRLGTDRIDLYYIHFMDLSTPVDETLAALDDLVKAGKVLYLGTSKWVPTLLTEAILTSSRYGWSRFVAEQPPYNLLDRSIEKELVYTALRHGVGLVPWAPLGTGILSGQYGSAADRPEGSRNAKGGVGAQRLTDAAVARAQALQPLATARGVTLAQFSLAWLLAQPAVTSPILGVRTLQHLSSALPALELKLTAAELDAVDALAPPGSAVSDYWDANTFARLRPTWLAQRRTGE
ncbi:MAG: aldo/keto reductase [Fimbriimonadaceae bacterium]|nr:aldo/keto reductase [Fimbriimonadaceae bacterium]